MRNVERSGASSRRRPGDEQGVGAEEQRDDSFVWIRANDGRLFQIARNAVTVWPDAVQS